MGAHRGVDHVALVVESIDDAVETYGRLLGAALEERELLAEQGVEAAMLFDRTRSDRVDRADASRHRSLASSKSEEPACITSPWRSTTWGSPSVSSKRPERRSWIQSRVVVSEGTRLPSFVPKSTHGVLVEVIARA